MGNKKFLFDVTFQYVIGDNPDTHEFTESFYCTRKQVEENVDMIERLAINFGRKIYETKIVLKS